MQYRVITKPRIIADLGVKHFVQAKPSWFPFFVRVTGNFARLGDAQDYIATLLKVTDSEPKEKSNES